MRRTRVGFTLIELLVVVAIIAVLMALLLPAVQKVRDAANRMKCGSNIKQLATALHAYHHDYKSFPPAPNVGSTGVGWLALILPYIEQNALGSTINPAIGAYVTGVNRTAGGTKITLFQCPSYPEENSSSTIDNVPGGGLAYTTHYVGNAGPKGTNPQTGAPYAVNGDPTSQGGLACEGLLPYHSSFSSTNPARPRPVRISDIKDGSSNTLLIFEVAWRGLEASPGSLRSWVRGALWNNDSTSSKNVRNAMRVVKYNGGGNYNDISMGSNHSNGCNVAFGDSSVRFLAESIDLNRVLLPLASRAGAEVVSLD